MVYTNDQSATETLQTAPTINNTCSMIKKTLLMSVCRACTKAIKLMIVSIEKNTNIKMLVFFGEIHVVSKICNIIYKMILLKQ